MSLRKAWLRATFKIIVLLAQILCPWSPTHRLALHPALATLLLPLLCLLFTMLLPRTRPTLLLLLINHLFHLLHKSSWNPLPYPSYHRISLTSSTLRGLWITPFLVNPVALMMTRTQSYLSTYTLS